MIISLTNTIETKKLITEEEKYVEEANQEQEIEESKSNQKNQMLTSLTNTVEITRFKN